MSRFNGIAETAVAWSHRHFFWLLISAYVAAGAVPEPGLRLRTINFGQVGILGESFCLTMPLLLLGTLLFNAGLGVQPRKVYSLLRVPRLLILGLTANSIIPIAFMYLGEPILGLWHDPVESQSILLGLALVAAMPIAGSSTAWSQHSNGDVALSLGLVLFSTLLSPLTTPFVFRAVSPLLSFDNSGDIQAFCSSGTSVLLGLFVMTPALCGVMVRSMVGEARLLPVQPTLKLTNAACLLLLIYSNAAVSLPESVAHPDVDFLVLVSLCVFGLCATTFVAGWLLGHWLHAENSQQMALMFGLGMNNNGAGLVLASFLLGAHPQVMLPIIVYNLVQHMVAGFAVRIMRSRELASHSLAHLQN